MSEHTVVSADDVADVYAGSDVPGTLTMRFRDEIERVGAGSVARVAPRTPRSHRNEGDEPVELWAISRKLDRQEAVKLDDFWEASPEAAQKR